MNAITEIFNKEVKHNPQILEQWEKGRLTIAEAVKIIALQTMDTVESSFDKEEREELGQRVYSVDVYEAMNNDETPATLAEAIRTNPNGIIRFLLDVIDEYQA